MNVHILACIVKYLLYCGRQCIITRNFITRNKGNSDGKENIGNCIAFLKVFEEHDGILRVHRNSPAIKKC